jgi:hypothetical protein
MSSFYLHYPYKFENIVNVLFMLSVVFIESSFPAHLSQYTKGDLFIYTKSASKFSHSNQRKIVVGDFLMRYLKIIFALLGFSCTFQGGFGLAFKLSRCKSVISDGILTELLYQEGHFHSDNFISAAAITPSIPVQKNSSKLILGNNFYEYGSFTLESYESYLRVLKGNYPDAYYFPHPREISNVPVKVFGDRLIENTSNIESYCQTHGIPSHIIGFLGSTAMVSIGKLANSDLMIDAIHLQSNEYDGPQKDISDPFLLKTRSIKVTFEVLEATALRILADVSNVTIKINNISLKC